MNSYEREGMIVGFGVFGIVVLCVTLAGLLAWWLTA